MATNVQDSRTTASAVEPVPTANGGVAVYDRPADGATNSTLRSTGTLHTDPAPVETRSSMSLFTWIIGVIVLIVLAYFLLQMIF